MDEYDFTDKEKEQIQYLLDHTEFDNAFDKLIKMYNEHGPEALNMLTKAIEKLEDNDS